VEERMKETEETVEDVKAPEFVQGEYVIGEVTYVQKALVLGQMKALTKLLKSVTLPKVLEPVAIAEAVEDVLHTAFAIVLIKKGEETPKEIKKQMDNLASTAEILEYTIDSNNIMSVINDFLYYNPINSILDLMRMFVSLTYLTNLTNQQKEIKEDLESGSTKSSSILQEETSSEEMKSSGDLP
jgi:hypothetical protein